MSHLFLESGSIQSLASSIGVVIACDQTSAASQIATHNRTRLMSHLHMMAMQNLASTVSIIGM